MSRELFIHRKSLIQKEEERSGEENSEPCTDWTGPESDRNVPLKAKKTVDFFVSCLMGLNTYQKK